LRLAKAPPEPTSAPGRSPQEEMLKMKDDPDELLKTKGKFRTKNIDPDDYLKIKELR
jgi:hypothetical protein